MNGSVLERRRWFCHSRYGSLGMSATAVPIVGMCSDTALNQPSSKNDNFIQKDYYYSGKVASTI